MASPPSQPAASRTALGVAALLLVVGAVLRAWARPLHSNLWAIDWLAYYEPQAEALRSLRLHRFLLGWEGLHPPVSGIIHGTLLAFGVPLLGHWIATTAATLLAALLGAEALRRSGPGGTAAGLLALAILCLSPLQANYGLNTSPYPWVLMWVAASTLATMEFVRHGGVARAGIAAALCGLAVETHVLALAVAVAHGLFLLGQGAAFRRAQAPALRRFFLVLAALCLPMVLGSVLKTTDPWTFHIEEGEPFWRTARMVLGQRFGARPLASALGALSVLSAVFAVARSPRGLAGLLALCLLGWCGALLLFLLVGVADPRLTHYYLVPQLLFVQLGALGLGVVASIPRSTPRRLLWTAAAGAVAAWGVEAVAWQDARARQVEQAIAAAAPAPETVRSLLRDAGEGDVVAYLWDHTFLNDEPEYLDPVSARWPLQRLGRRCPESDPPRGLCNASGGARFYFDPSAFAGPLSELEEPLRLMVNSAHPPGRARIVLLPGPDAPPPPFAAEVFLADQGGAMRASGGSVRIWEFPPGARIEPPAGPVSLESDPEPLE